MEQHAFTASEPKWVEKMKDMDKSIMGRGGSHPVVGKRRNIHQHS